MTLALFGGMRGGDLVTGPHAGTCVAPVRPRRAHL
jgi:hypothetical protein